MDEHHPQTGGNIFSEYFLGNYTNDKLQAVNISAQQVAAGFVSQTATSRIFDFNPAFGGPLANKMDSLLGILGGNRLAVE